MRPCLPTVWIALAGALFAACPKSNTVQASPGLAATTVLPRTATLVFTSNVRGWVEPCGCTADPLGGIDRIKAQLDGLRAQGATLFFDTGGMLFDRLEIPAVAYCQEDSRVALLLRSAAASGLKFTAVGPYDLARGEAYRAAALRATGLTALAANVEGAAGSAASRLEEVGGIQVGFTSVTWPAAVALPAAQEVALSWQGLQLTHPFKAAAREAGKLRQAGAVVVVVLSQMSRAHSAQLGQQVPGLDLVVVGHEPGEEPAAPQEVARGTWLLAAGQQGQHLGKITLRMPTLGQSCCLTLDDHGAGAKLEAERLRKRAAQLEEQAAEFELHKDTVNAQARRKKAAELLTQSGAVVQAASGAVAGANNFSFETVPLNSKVAGDAAVNAQLKAYKASLGSLNAACDKDTACPPAKAGEAAYVGSKVCQDCHEAAYDFWQKAVREDAAKAAQYSAQKGHPNPRGFMGHARAWQTLMDSKATGNRDCVGCHSVGFEQPGGFCKVAEGSLWGNVGCESCHGPGGKHVESEEEGDIVAQVPEATCRGCHHVPHIPSTQSFVYADKLRTILGKGHGEARLKALGAR